MGKERNIIPRNKAIPNNRKNDKNEPQIHGINDRISVSIYRI